MDSKKVSFGFSKLPKKSNIISTSAKQEIKKIELIECLEGQSIKIKNAVDEVKQPLIIPIKGDKNNILERIKEARKKEKLLKEQPEDSRPDSELTTDELAARELMREAKIRLENKNLDKAHKISVLPLNEDTIILEGEQEPTLRDYESVPIADYGLALLRGMGWKDGMPIGKSVSKTSQVSIPELRPKGLGLGASKIVQSEIPAQKAIDKDGNELILMKGAYAKVIMGPQKGNYCEVQGFDEEAGRVIVKVYPVGEILNINELMVVPVSQNEFSKGSKIINNAKYEEYKQISDTKIEKYKHVSNANNSEENNKNRESPTNKVQSRKHEYKSLDSGNKKELLGTFSKSRYKGRSLSRDKYKKDEKGRHKSHKGRNLSRDRSGDHSESSNNEYYKTKKNTQKSTKSKHQNRNRSRSLSRNKDIKESSDSEYYEAEKRSLRHSKPKHKSRLQRRVSDGSSSTSDRDYRKNNRKRNKSKHNRHNSSDEN